MADESISLELFIEADKANLTLGELEQGFESMKEQLKNVGRGSEEFKKLSTAMAATSAEVKNIELGFEGLDSEQVASELGSVAGAVGDITTAFVLMGDESESMQEVAKNIEKAMAVSMGFKGAIEGVSSGMKLYNNLVKTGKIQTMALAAAQKVAAIAQAALNFVMSLNPISIIILAVAGLIAGFVALSGTIGSLIDSALKPFQWAIDLVTDALKTLGIMETDSAKATREAEESKAKAAADSAKIRRQEIESLIKANKKLTDSIVNDLDFEIRKRTAAGETVTELELEKLRILIASAKEQKRLHEEALLRLDEEIKARFKAGESLAQLAIDRLNTTVEHNKAIKEENTKQIEAEQDLEIFILEIKKEASDKRKEIRDKEAEDIQSAFEARKDIEKIEIRENDLAKEEEIEKEETHVTALMLIAKKQADQDKADHEEVLARAKAADARRQQSLNSAQASLDILGGAADLFVKDEIKREKIKKKLAIAQLAIDTARAISGGIAAAAGIPFPGNLIAFLPTVATIIANMAKAKQLLGGGRVSVSSGSLGTGARGASDGGGGAFIDPVSNTSTVLGNNAPVVEVVEINKFQKKVGVIEASATF